MITKKSEAALLKKVWAIANVLSAAGVSFTDYVEQLTYLLFLKMDDEKEALGLGSSLPDGCRWKNLVACSGEDLVKAYDNILSTLSDPEKTPSMTASSKASSPARRTKSSSPSTSGKSSTCSRKKTGT